MRGGLYVVAAQSLRRSKVSLQSSSTHHVRCSDLMFGRFADSRHGAVFDFEQLPPTPTGQYSEEWYQASLAYSVLSGDLSRKLFARQVKHAGIPVSTLNELINLISAWRDVYLSKLGVPSKWPEDWDFLAAITACSTDVYYHCLWLIVMRAIDDFGIISSEDKAEEVKVIKEKYKTESDHGAMRIAALVCPTIQYLTR